MDLRLTKKFLNHDVPVTSPRASARNTPTLPSTTWTCAFSEVVQSVVPDTALVNAHFF